MKTIYKYQIQTVNSQIINVPTLGKIDSFSHQVLKIDMQKGIPCIWCMVDTERKERKVKLRVFGTGHEITDLKETDYLGSYMLSNGDLVFHVFLDYCEE